jgi:CRP/FNR family cyclic AMP-dependent transcriptional regulator
MEMTTPSIEDQLIPLLRGVGLFSRCSDADLRMVARRATVREVSRDERILTEGELGSELYIVLLGGAEARSGGVATVSFGPGDHFGELAALLPAPRTSDVVATDRTLLAILTRDQVYSLLDVVPGAARKMLEGLAGSLRDQLLTH